MRLGLLRGIYLLLLLASAGGAVYFRLISNRASITVDWSTASEIDTTGYNLYRGDNPDGPFEKVNPELITASIDPLVGGQYAFKDQSVQPGRTYYYMLEDIDIHGTQSRNGPIVISTPPQGQLETFLSMLLMVVSIYCLISLWRSHKSKEQLVR